MSFSAFVKWAFGIFTLGLLMAVAAFFVFQSQQEPLEMDKEARKKAPGDFVALSNGLTHYRLLGREEGELVILIHGGMVSGMYAWENNYQALVDSGFQVLMYDLYGRGFSDRKEEEYTPDLFFNQFEELLDSLQIKKPFQLAGLSLGSMVAIDYTRNHPEKVKKVMLLSPAARGKFKLHPALEVPFLSNVLMTAYWFPRTVGNQMEEFYQPRKFPQYEEKLREMIRYKGYKTSNYSTWVNTLTYNMEPQIREIGEQNTPVALVLGEHDPYVSADEAITYQQLLPNVQVYQIPEAGHIVNFEQADTVNKLMLEFFSSE